MTIVALLSGCAWFAGGGSYHYQYQDTSGKTIDVTVDSVREIGFAKVHITPEGEVIIDVEGIAPGPNNMVLIPITIEQLGKLVAPVL
jgi:hypothetical protein